MQYSKKKQELARKSDFILDSCATTSRMPAYDGLLDRNLIGYFASSQVRKTLVKQGLINKEGVVLDNKRDRFLPSSSADLLAVKQRFAQSTSPDKRSSKKKLKKTKVKPLTSAELHQVIKAHQTDVSTKAGPAELQKNEVQKKAETEPPKPESLQKAEAEPPKPEAVKLPDPPVTEASPNLQHTEVPKLVLQQNSSEVEEVKDEIEETVS